MISPKLVADIRRYFFAEHWKVGTIAAELQLHPDTVKRALETERFRSRTAIALPTDPFLEFIERTLKEHPRLRATRLLQMLGDRGFQGNIHQLRRVVRRLRPASTEAFLRLSVLPGEQAQVDWASFGTVTVGRAQRKLSCFLLTLSHSRAFYLEFFFDQRMENFLLGHVNAFKDLGGTPRNILYDNLKSAVLERHGDAIAFHPRLLELCGHYHFAPRPCNPRRGNEKGRVERAIRYVREAFFAARPFHSIESLNRQALEWRDCVTLDRRLPDNDSITVAQAWEQERPRLIRLPAHPFETDLHTTINSRKTIYVRFDLNDYSIPHSMAGRTLTLIASPSIVRLLDGRTEIARHRRSYDRGQRIEDPAHIAALLEMKRKALGATAGSRLSQAVPNSQAFLEAALDRGESPARQTTELLTLLDDYGAQALNEAIAEALDKQSPRARTVAYLLGRKHKPTQPAPHAVDLSRHPHLEHLSVSTHQLEVYDELSNHNRNDRDAQ